jgi:SpoVK/Ycf46/Vps4 family AAA+-type ATPase
VTAAPVDRTRVMLQRLDVLLHREILRLRVAYQLSLDEFRGLYVSDAQVDALVSQTAPADVGGVEELTERAESMRHQLAECADDRWARIAREFCLSSAEQDVLLMAVAPEIHLKYETFYAYLNNDVTRKWPTFDLALRVTGADRSSLTPEAPLLSSGLIEPVGNSTERPSWLACGFRASPTVAPHLLDVPSRDPLLSALSQRRTPGACWEDVPATPQVLARLRCLPTLFAEPGIEPPVIVLEGRKGSGRHAAAEALCRALDIDMLRVDLATMRSASGPPEALLRALGLEQRLRPAAICFSHAESLVEGDPANANRGLLQNLTLLHPPLIFIAEPGQLSQDLLAGQLVVRVDLGGTDYEGRLQQWRVATGGEVPDDDLRGLADRFQLTPGQISAAVLATRHSMVLNGSDLASQLFEAAKSQSGGGLGKLAYKVPLVQTWRDLVLPPPTLDQLREVLGAIEDRPLVHGTWGFESRLVTGKGLKVLFAGPSGTGKTMAASVVADALNLDLYKIDLSGIVSKFIGETEKNLDRIFGIAAGSNAILFFDEADALFGKRSEVKDAHDRFANIEIAYLLQKMDEYEGVVILATNLRRNIDEAFSRRMHYVVEFPMPDESHRERIWRAMFPAEAPLADDIDFAFLAHQFSLAPGDIKNVVLNAAFLAASDGRIISMRHLIKAMGRQMMKQGKVPAAADFKQYHALLAEERQ